VAAPAAAGPAAAANGVTPMSRQREDRDVARAGAAQAPDLPDLGGGGGEEVGLELRLRDRARGEGLEVLQEVVAPRPHRVERARIGRSAAAREVFADLTLTGRCAPPGGVEVESSATRAPPCAKMFPLLALLAPGVKP
jgi:hypothetical protein